MAELVGISEGYEYQHNGTKIENQIYATRENSKFAIVSEHTTYMSNLPMAQNAPTVMFVIFSSQENPHPPSNFTQNNLMNVQQWLKK